MLAVSYSLQYIQLSFNISTLLPLIITPANVHYHYSIYNHFLTVLRAQAEAKARALLKYKQDHREDTGYMEGGYYDGFEKSHR